MVILSNLPYLGSGIGGAGDGAVYEGALVVQSCEALALVLEDVDDPVAQVWNRMCGKMWKAVGGLLG